MQAFAGRSSSSRTTVTFLDRTVDRGSSSSTSGHTVRREYAGGWSEYEAEHERRRVAPVRALGGATAPTRRKPHRGCSCGGMQQWEERGYGQGRKKKKTKDVKKSIGGRIEQARHASTSRTSRGSCGSSSRHRPAAATSSCRLERAVVERGSFRLGPLDLELAWAERACDRRAERKRQDDAARRAARASCRSPHGTRRARTGRRARRGSPSSARSLPTESRCSQFVHEGCGLHEEDARTLLAKFGPRRRPRPARRRLAIARRAHARADSRSLVARGVNCLVLDEPTNHLDVEAIEELERALDSLPGTVLLVTHDRRFLAGFPRYADAGAVTAARFDRARAGPSLTSRSTRVVVEEPPPAEPRARRSRVPARRLRRALPRRSSSVDAAVAARIGICLVVAEELARMRVPALGQRDPKAAADDRATPFRAACAQRLQTPWLEAQLGLQVGRVSTVPRWSGAREASAQASASLHPRELGATDRVDERKGSRR